MMINAILCILVCILYIYDISMISLPFFSKPNQSKRNTTLVVILKHFMDAEDSNPLQSFFTHVEIVCIKAHV